jgi:hypothetical protein
MSEIELIHEKAVPDSDDRLEEHDVAQIRESIQEAEYFDASSMAPLSPASVVSVRIPRIKSCSLISEGCCSTVKSI